MSANIRCFDLANELSHQPALARVEVRLPNGETRPIEGVVYTIKPIARGGEPRRCVQIIVGPAATRLEAKARKSGVTLRLQQLIEKVVRHGS